MATQPDPTFNHDALAAFWDHLDAQIAAANEARLKRQNQWTEAGRQAVSISAGPFTAADRHALRSYLESPHAQPPQCSVHMAMPLVMQGIDALASAGTLSPMAAIKMVLFFEPRRDFGAFLPDRIRQVIERVHQATGSPTLLELAGMLEDAGLSARGPLLDYCRHTEHALGRNWPDEHVSPYFEQHKTELMQLLLDRKGIIVSHSDSGASDIRAIGLNREAVYRAAAMVARTSPAFVDALFGIAFGTTASERELAQSALRSVEGHEARIAGFIDDRKAKTRAIAAQWLAQLGNPAARPLLDHALQGEKNEATRIAMSEALHSLNARAGGSPVSSR
jgi:hypothetical protein